MRTLKFIVNGQTIAPDPSCDFSGLYPGSEGYLQAEFTFTEEWKNTAKVVAFYSNLGREYEPQILKSNKPCTIPAEALKKRVFKIQVIGKTKEGLRLETNKLAVHQKGG